MSVKVDPFYRIIFQVKLWVIYKPQILTIKMLAD